MVSNIIKEQKYVLSFELNQTVEVLPYSVWLVPTLIGRKYQLNKLSLGSTLLFRNLKSNNLQILLTGQLGLNDYFGGPVWGGVCRGGP